jgi:HTH-type transcriptional regulator/antitoxin HigA
MAMHLISRKRLQEMWSIMTREIGKMIPGSESTYDSLLNEHRPSPIHTESEYDRLMALIETYYPRRNESEGISRFMELVTLLVHDYEERVHVLPALHPIDLLKVLMAERGLKQKDMLDVFKTKSIVSEVLHGKRDLTREHIERLALKFYISPAAFFPLQCRAIA